MAFAARTWVTASRWLKLCTRNVSFSARRQILSEAYSCQDTWTKRLECPILQQVSFSQFAVKLLEKYDKEKNIDVVDMEILANKVSDMDISEVDLVEDLICKFQYTQSAYPVRHAITHPIIRAFLELHMADRLMPMVVDKLHYGLLPDRYTSNFMLDYFIKQENYAEAAKVAYELMLQEDWSDPLSRLLACIVCLRRLHSAAEEELAEPGPPVLPEEGDITMTAVKLVDFPFYDDHFSISSERFLLGKTLYSLGREMQEGLVAGSLLVLGLGLYHKFPRGIQTLSTLLSSSASGPVIAQEALTWFEKCVTNAETREEEIPEKEFGLLRIEDELYKLRPTQADKEAYISEFQSLKQKLEEGGRVSQEALEPVVAAMLTETLPLQEPVHIQQYQNSLQTWRQERQARLDSHLREMQRKAKEEEIKGKLKELQEKEELLSFFEQKEEVLLAKKRAMKEKPPEPELDEETLNAQRIKRRRYRHNIIQKK